MRVAVALAICTIALSACVSQRPRTASVHFQPPARHYSAPGPMEDPWRPYIRAASARFGVSEIWIRAVMQQESGGDLYRGDGLVTSPVGAMGLMQVMPDTYAQMRDRYGLGDDPYEPHDNIFAGAAYIRLMYDAFGFPAFLAAYNAGPDETQACLVMGVPLPQETVSYLQSVAPRLRDYAPRTGLLAAYAELPSDAVADDLNRRMLTGQALPVADVRAQPASLPCQPPASDRSADALNRAALVASQGAAPDPATDALNRQSLAHAVR